MGASDDEERAPLALEGDEVGSTFSLMEPNDDLQELGNGTTSQHRYKQICCVFCTLLAAAIACCVVVYLGIGAFWREASVVYTVDEDGHFIRTVRYPKGYGVVYYNVEPGEICSAASNKPCHDFKLGAGKGYSFTSFKTKKVSRSSRDYWFTPGERDVELGVNFRIPLETHVQVGNAHKKLSKNRTISERCGSYVVITKFYESVYKHLDEMIDSWSGTEIAPAFGTYDAATNTYNPRIAIPDLYGVVRYNEKKYDDLWVANARLPAGYGWVWLKVEPDLGGDGLHFSCDLGGFDSQGSMAQNIQWGGNDKLYFPERGDVETVVLPPEHYVKISSSSTSTGGTPAQMERSGSYAVLTKNPKELYQRVCDLVDKNWWIPHGKVEFTDLTHWQVTVPDQYGVVQYGVWPASGSDEPRPAWEKDSPCNISLEPWPYDSSFSGCSNFPLYHPEMGDKAFRTLALGEHVKVSNTSYMYPFQPKNETLARQCGTYVVMTDDARGLAKSLDNAMICKMLE